MIKDLRIVQDHGWLQQPDGNLVWGPTQFWLEYLNELNEWKKLDVVKINEFPGENDPLYEPQINH
jgi:hypothetical protein